MSLPMTRTRRNLLILILATIAIIGLAVLSWWLPQVAFAHATKFYMVCEQRKVIEADSFTATVVRTHNDHANKFFAYWHTDDGTANTDDYNDVNNVYQLSSSGATRMNRTISTKHDARIESTETFTVRFSPTTNVLDSNHPDKDEKCNIKIIDDDAEITLSEPRWGKWYTAGETIEFTARFGEAVTWAVDNKTLEFSLGVGDDAQTKTATYISGKGTNQIKFGYTVEAGDLDPNGLYVARNSFRGGDLKNVAQDIYFGPRNAAKSYPDNRVDGSLADVSTGIQTSYDPWGIAVDGDTLYISAAKTESSNYLIGIWANDFTDDTGGVYARDTSKDFNSRTRSNWWAVRGIFVSDNRLYVAEPHNERVPGYSLNGSWSHSWRNRVKTHADEWIQGIWPDTSDSDNKRLYVVSHNEGKIRAYNYPGDGNTINHDSDRDIDLHSDNSWPRGVWSNGATIWVADSADDKLYAYAFIDNLLGPSSSRGDRLPDSDIDLHRANDNPKGIWSDGRRFYVVDSETKRVFKYPYNAAHPDKPANVIATATSSSEITLTWDPPADVGSSAIVSYRSRYRAAGEANWQEGFRNRLASLDRSFDFTGLTADTAYDFQVFATNDHGESHASITVQGRTHEAVNQAPECSSPISDLRASVGELFESLPPFGCIDPEDETLTYTATLSDDSALPAWLSFRASDAWFSGTPTNDDAAGGNLTIKVTATDPHGLNTSRTFILLMRGYQAPSDDAPTVVSAIADQSFYIGDSVSLKMTGTITDTEDGEALTFSVDKPVPEANWLRAGLQSGSLYLRGTVPETMTRGTVIAVTVYGVDNALQSADYTFSITSLGSRSTNPTPVNPREAAPIITEPVEFGDYVIMRQGPGYICGDPEAEYVVVLAVKVDPPADGSTLAPDPEGFVDVFNALLEVAKANLGEGETVADIDLDALEEEALEATYAKHWRFNDKVAEFGNEHDWPTTISQKVVWAYYHNGHNEYHRYAHDHGRSFEF